MLVIEDRGLLPLPDRVPNKSRIVVKMLMTSGKLEVLDDHHEQVPGVDGVGVDGVVGAEGSGVYGVVGV